MVYGSECGIVWNIDECGGVWNMARTVEVCGIWLIKAWGKYLHHFEIVVKGVA